MRYAKWLSRTIIPLFFLSLVAQVGDTRGLYEAFREGKVDIQVYGNGIQRVRGTVTRRAGSAPLKIKILPGTLFGANSGSVQNMVVTDGMTVDLTRARSATFKASVACTDLHLSVPGESDSFTVEQLPDRKAEIVKFFPIANRAFASYETKQAGVWIVTDDADYRALGILVGGFGGGNGRAINAGEAADAMALLEKSGIDVTSHSIWRQRLQICSAALSRAFISTPWCEKVLRDTSSAEWKISALSDKNPAVSAATRKWLLQAKDDETRAALVRALSAPGHSDDTVVTIVETMGNYTGTDVGDAVLPLLAADSPEVKVASINSLTKMQDPRTPDSVRPLTSSSETMSVRLAAIRSLGILGSSDELEVLQEAAKDSSPKVRSAATLAIQQARRRQSSVQ